MNSRIQLGESYDGNNMNQYSDTTKQKSSNMPAHTRSSPARKSKFDNTQQYQSSLGFQRQSIIDQFNNTSLLDYNIDYNASKIALNSNLKFSKK